MNMDMKQLGGMVFAVILVVLGMAFGSEIIDSAVTLINHKYATDFIGLVVVGKVIPTIYYLGILGIAGGIGYASYKGATNRKKGVGG